MNVADFANLYLGHASWGNLKDGTIAVRRDSMLGDEAASWIRFDQIFGQDLPPVRHFFEQTRGWQFASSRGVSAGECRRQAGAEHRCVWS